MWLVVRGKSAQYQSSESNLVKIVVAIMNHEPGGNQADVLRSCSIQKGCPWNETFVGDPDPDLRAQQYMPLLLQWEIMSHNFTAEWVSWNKNLPFLLTQRLRNTDLTSQPKRGYIAAKAEFLTAFQTE